MYNLARSLLARKVTSLAVHPCVAIEYDFCPLIRKLTSIRFGGAGVNAESVRRPCFENIRS
jgi:hypothetical protein